MTDPLAIAGSISGYRTLADGALRIQIDLPETEAAYFHQLFPQVHVPVAVAPLARETDEATPPATAAEEAPPAEPERGKYGHYAKALRLSAFFQFMDVWRATGSDKAFLDFVRSDAAGKCVARAGAPCAGDMVPAHVRRVANGAGTAVKPPYSAVRMCSKHHDLQHLKGEDSVGGGAYLDAKRFETVVAWIWFEIKKSIGVSSMADAEPAKVLQWAQKKGVDRWLPALYKKAA